MEDLITVALLSASAFFVALSFALLYRYRQVSKEINASNDVGKDLWDALEGRLKKQDERILDMMGRVEVIQSRALQGMVPPTSVQNPVQDGSLKAIPGRNVRDGRKLDREQDVEETEGQTGKSHLTSQPPADQLELERDLETRFEKQDQRLSEVVDRLTAIQVSLTTPQKLPTQIKGPMMPVPQTQGRPTTKRVDDKVLLQMLNEKPITSMEVRRRFDISREHASRVLKDLYAKGLVVENSSHKPFVYELTDAGRERFSSSSR